MINSWLLYAQELNQSIKKMKNSRSFLLVAFAATTSFASAANILVSASDTSEIEAFLAANYSDANVTAAGDFSNFNAAEHSIGP